MNSSSTNDSRSPLVSGTQPERIRFASRAEMWLAPKAEVTILKTMSAFALFGLFLVGAVERAYGQVEIPDQPEFHLFLLAGQSNMAGRGTIEPQDQVEHPRVLSLNEAGEWQPATAPLHFDKLPLVGVGLGRSFALAYAEAHPDVTVGLIPCAVGGSPIDSWVPGGIHQETGAHPYDETLQRVSLARESGVLKGILWHQGESDSKAQLARSYEAKLARLVDRFRAEFDAPNLPFVIGQMGEFVDRPWDEHRKVVDAAHKSVANRLHRTDFVWSTALNHKGDHVHFDAAAYRELGQRYFQAYMRIANGMGPEIVSIQRVWDRATHNAFTDLTRFKGRWYCAFREGQHHVSKDGAIRVISSADGKEWQSIALLTHEKADLRDAKIVVSAHDELMVYGAGALHQPSEVHHQTYVWVMKEGMEFQRHEVGEPDYWLWRVSWHGDRAYGVGYRTGGNDRRDTRLYESEDGIHFRALAKPFFEEGYPNESSIVFAPNETAYCLLRRDPFQQVASSGQLGIARPPYEHWDWKDLGERIGGPHWIMLPDGRLCAAVRLYDGHVRTALVIVDPQQGRMRELLRLPSAGDTSYAGLVFHEGQLWISYYSQHESLGNHFQTAIYVAQVKL